MFLGGDCNMIMYFSSFEINVEYKYHKKTQETTDKGGKDTQF